MGKNNRHKKQLKSEKAKVKLKGANKFLPKGTNVTDASFKAKKILIREQLKEHEGDQILSRRKLNLKELLVRLQHYNPSVRQDAIRELKDILAEHAINDLNIQLNSLLKGIAALVLDKERPVRREALKALNLVLSPLSKEQISPFCDILVSYLTCAMTHLHQNIMEDSLLFLDLLIQHCSHYLANNSNKILLYFLDMISKLCTQAKPGRLLTTTINSKNTSMKWRLKVLHSLQQFLFCVIQHVKNSILNSSKSSCKELHVKDDNRYFPIYDQTHLQIWRLDLIKKEHILQNKKGSLNLPTLQKYIESLMPLIFDSWLEVCPSSQENKNSSLSLSVEAASLLKCITSIIQSIIEYIEILENDSRESDYISGWFKSKYNKSLQQNLMLNFPYEEQKSGFRPKKSKQEQPMPIVPIDCVEQNLNLAFIYFWFATPNNRKESINLDKKLNDCLFNFLIDTISNWSGNNASGISSLSKVLQILFLKASMTNYKDKTSVINLFESCVDVYSQETKKELHQNLFSILSDIALDHHLRYLHEEKAFETFLKSIPALFLKNKIHKVTIEKLNAIIARFKQHIQKELLDNYDAIIANSKTINVIGSENEENSRRMIQDLGHYLSGKIVK
ncbi:testis-expressed protein 10 homolog [Trichogramma pretiosum]|uniref:testis-expressed protein 10 homolog n=1 Tax=Trichogramma pretiosum TaxID=7493 RepID=UPI0006C9ACBA|nr:testis-expressed protein 10 homolog [Trichogramma pretiosum]